MLDNLWNLNRKLGICESDISDVYRTVTQHTKQLSAINDTINNINAGSGGGNTAIATSTDAGIIKPDNVTTSVDANGVLSVVSSKFATTNDLNSIRSSCVSNRLLNAVIDTDNGDISTMTTTLATTTNGITEYKKCKVDLYKQLFPTAFNTYSAEFMISDQNKAIHYNDVVRIFVENVTYGIIDYYYTVGMKLDNIECSFSNDSTKHIVLRRTAHSGVGTSNYTCSGFDVETTNNISCTVNIFIIHTHGAQIVDMLSTADLVDDLSSATSDTAFNASFVKNNFVKNADITVDSDNIIKYNNTMLNADICTKTYTGPFTQTSTGSFKFQLPFVDTNLLFKITFTCNHAAYASTNKQYTIDFRNCVPINNKIAIKYATDTSKYWCAFEITNKLFMSDSISSNNIPTFDHAGSIIVNSVEYYLPDKYVPKSIADNTYATKSSVEALTSDPSYPVDVTYADSSRNVAYATKLVNGIKKHVSCTTGVFSRNLNNNTDTIDFGTSQSSYSKYWIRDGDIINLCASHATYGTIDYHYRVNKTIPNITLTFPNDSTKNITFTPNIVESNNSMNYICKKYILGSNITVSVISRLINFSSGTEIIPSNISFLNTVSTPPFTNSGTGSEPKYSIANIKDATFEITVMYDAIRYTRFYSPTLPVSDITQYSNERHIEILKGTYIGVLPDNTIILFTLTAVSPNPARALKYFTIANIRYMNSETIISKEYADNTYAKKNDFNNALTSDTRKVYGPFTYQNGNSIYLPFYNDSKVYRINYTYKGAVNSFVTNDGISGFNSCKYYEIESTVAFGINSTNKTIQLCTSTNNYVNVSVVDIRLYCINYVEEELATVSYAVNTFATKDELNKITGTKIQYLNESHKSLIILNVNGMREEILCKYGEFNRIISSEQAKLIAAGGDPNDNSIVDLNVVDNKNYYIRLGDYLHFIMNNPLYGDIDILYCVTTRITTPITITFPKYAAKWIRFRVIDYNLSPTYKITAFKLESNIECVVHMNIIIASSGKRINILNSDQIINDDILTSTDSIFSSIFVSENYRRNDDLDYVFPKRILKVNKTIEPSKVENNELFFTREPCSIIGYVGNSETLNSCTQFYRFDIYLNGSDTWSINVGNNFTATLLEDRFHITNSANVNLYIKEYRIRTYIEIQRPNISDKIALTSEVNNAVALGIDQCNKMFEPKRSFQVTTQYRMTKSYISDVQLTPGTICKGSFGLTSADGAFETCYYTFMIPATLSKNITVLSGFEATYNLMSMSSASSLTNIISAPRNCIDSTLNFIIGYKDGEYPTLVGMIMDDKDAFRIKANSVNVTLSNSTHNEIPDGFISVNFRGFDNIGINILGVKCGDIIKGLVSVGESYNSHKFELTIPNYLEPNITLYQDLYNTNIYLSYIINRSSITYTALMPQEVGVEDPNDLIIMLLANKYANEITYIQVVDGGTNTLEVIQILRSKPVKQSTTITHYAPVELPDENLSKIELGKPVFMSGKVYMQANNHWYESTVNDTTDCISSVIPEGTYKEYIGIVSAIDIDNKSVTFCSHGDYLFKVDDSTKYNIGDTVLFDGTVLDEDAPITNRIIKSIVGRVSSIIDSTHISVFKD